MLFLATVLPLRTWIKFRGPIFLLHDAMVMMFVNPAVTANVGADRWGARWFQAVGGPITFALLFTDTYPWLPLR